jgi:hypothetical protein
MRMSSFAPELAKAASVALAVAAVAIIGFTALADSRGATRVAPTPTRPPSPVPVSTLPGSVDRQSTEPAAPAVPASKARVWMKALVGKWAQTTRDDYFQFHSDGTGEWVAYGQRLWTGTFSPRDAKTFDLSDAHGEGASYWRVRLIGGGRKLYFAGTQQTYPKA